MAPSSYTSQINMFACSFALKNWSFCSGQLLAIAQNTGLYALVGTNYGGDGSSTFGLPDFRSRWPVGSSDMGTDPNLAPYSIGQKDGQQTQALTTLEMAPHTHTATFTETGGGVTGSSFEGYNGGATRVTPVAGDYISGNSATIFGVGGGFGSTKVALAGLTVTSTPVTGSVTVDTAGSGQAFSVMNPIQAVNFQICMSGYYPIET